MEAVKFLLEAGADSDHTFEGKYPVLICTASLGHVDLAKLLISAGVNIN